jgi:hypothetical protein
MRRHGSHPSQLPDPVEIDVGEARARGRGDRRPTGHCEQRVEEIAPFFLASDPSKPIESRNRAPTPLTR